MKIQTYIVITVGMFHPPISSRGVVKQGRVLRKKALWMLAIVQTERIYTVALEPETPSSTKRCARLRCHEKPDFIRCDVRRVGAENRVILTAARRRRAIIPPHLHTARIEE